MEFRTAKNHALEMTQNGCWKPLFKARYNENYFDRDNREEYENKLKKKFFTNPQCNMVISRNTYPFIFEKGIEQYVIWIKDSDQDPGIIVIKKLVEKAFPELDHIVLINQPRYRSIKSILHYHAIIKPPSLSFCLQKLIVFHRHGNREPITKFPIVEKELGNYDVSDNIEAKLLPIGYLNSHQFGLDLKNIYLLQPDFLEKSFFFTSPVIRCQQTILEVMKGLGTGSYKSFGFLEELKIFLPSTSIYLVESLFDDKQKYYHLFEILIKGFGLSRSSNYFIDLYNIHSSIQCYRDMGIKIEKYLSPEAEKDLNNVVVKIYNYVCHFGQLVLFQQLETLLSYLWNLDANLIVCSTHDTLVFMLTKYLAAKNNIFYDYELPCYLSNVRIEQWSDGVNRVFYNNFYLGDFSN